MSQQTVILITLILYKLSLIGIGLWAASRVRAEDDFFLGGRAVGPLVSGLSYAASTSSAWVLLGFSGFVFTTGLSALWMVPGIWAGYVVMWVWVGPKLREESARLNHITLTDYMISNLSVQQKYRRAIALLSTFLIIVCFIFYIAAQFDAAAKAFVDQFELSFTHSVLLGAIIILAYCLLGGFWAVSVTDTVQGFMMLVIAVVLPLVALINAGGFGAVFSSLAVSTSPIYLQPFAGMGLMLFIGFLLGVWGIGAGALGQPHLLARLMAIKDEKARRQGFAVAMSWGVLVYVGMAVLALSGRALIETSGAAFPDNGEAIFYRVASHVFPPVLAGVVIAATLSAVMSTVDSILLAASAAVAHDLGLNARNPQRAVLISRIVMTGIAVFAVILTLTLPDTIFNRVLFAWAALGAGFGPVIVARVAGKNPSGALIFASILIGFSTTVFFYLLGSMETETDGIFNTLISMAKLPGDPFERFIPWLVPLALLFFGPSNNGDENQ